MGGDRQMMAAWDVLADEFVRIRSGQADELRHRCKSGRLICPFEGCGARAITTWNGYTNRWGTYVSDGFRHVEIPPEGEHSPESVRHLNGKSAVRDWLRDLRFTSVSLERPQVVREPHGRSTATKRRTRRPDVRGRHPDGRLVLIEVQVSPLSELEWRERTHDLRSNGGAVIWLWSWSTEHHRHAMTTALRASVEAGHDVWFLDPGSERGPILGWAWQARWIGGEEFKAAPHDLSAPLSFEWWTLAELTVGPDGRVRRPGGADEAARLDAALRQQDATEEAAERVRVAERERLALWRAAAVEQDRRLVAAAEERRVERLARAALRETTSRPTSLDADLAEACERENHQDAHVWAPVGTWKPVTVQRLLGRDTLPARITRSSVVEFVERTFPCDAGTTEGAVRALLYDLEAVGAVRVQGGRVIVVRPPTSRGAS